MRVFLLVTTLLSLHFAPSFADPLAKSVINRFAQTQNEEAGACTPLTGGFSGSKICKFRIGQKQYVLRLFRNDLPYLIKARQYKAAKYASELGIAPKTLYFDPDQKGFVRDFLYGDTVKKREFRSSFSNRRFAKLLKTLHTSTLPFPKAPGPIDQFYKNIREGEKNQVPYPSNMELAKQTMEEIQGLLYQFPVKEAPAHLDLNALNIMRSQGKYQLIDWENGGLSDPYFDLAMFPVFLRLEKDQEEEFLKEYFRNEPTEIQKARYELTKPVACLVRASNFLKGKEVPEKIKTLPLEELLELHENEKLELSRWEIGLSLLNSGLKLAQTPKFNQAKQTLYDLLKKDL